MKPRAAPVSIAEEILQLTRSAFSSADGRDESFEIYDAKARLQDLCNKLLLSALGRLEYTALLAESCQESSALGFVTTLGVADAIADGTATVDELSTKLEVDPRFLATTMSSLSKLNYFEEVGGFGSQTYKNNDLSDILRAEHPESLKDAVEFICDEGFKSTSVILEAAKLPAPNQKKATGARIAFKFPGNVFEWMAEHEWRGRRMGKAMVQLHRMANQNTIVDYPWNTLISPIVDVGGGIGSLEMALWKREENDGLKFTIFDIPATIENAKETWEAQPLSRLSRVSFVAGDFLAPTVEETRLPCGQPTYLIRHVLHDWTDEEVIRILRNVREAMLTSRDSGKTSKLLLCEILLKEKSSRFVRSTSMQLLTVNDGYTRTEGEMVALTERSGFKVQKVHHMRAIDSIVEAIPV